MTGNWKAQADALVHDLENKGYEIVDRVASVAEEALEAVFSVVEEAQERVAEAKASAEAKNGTTFADLWKEFTDTVEQSAQTAPVESLEDKAKRAYFYMTENVNSDYRREFEERDDYWARYYAKGQNLGEDYWWNSLVRDARTVGFEG